MLCILIGDSHRARSRLATNLCRDTAGSQKSDLELAETQQRFFWQSRLHPLSGQFKFATVHLLARAAPSAMEEAEHHAFSTRPYLQSTASPPRHGGHEPASPCSSIKNRTGPVLLCRSVNFERRNQHFSGCSFLLALGVSTWPDVETAAAI